MKLIKITEDNYIIVDNSEIKVNDWFFNTVQGNIYCNNIPDYNVNKDYLKKITHSTQPLDIKITDEGIHLPDWSKVKALSPRTVKELIGVVDKAFERYPIIENDKDHNDRNYYRRSAYYQALEDNKDKKYTEADLRKAIDMARDIKDNSAHDVFTVEDISGCTEVCTYDWRNRYKDEEIIESLQPKTEWEVEFINGKLKLK